MIAMFAMYGMIISWMHYSRCISQSISPLLSLLATREINKLKSYFTPLLDKEQGGKSLSKAGAGECRGKWKSKTIQPRNL